MTGATSRKEIGAEERQPRRTWTLLFEIRHNVGGVYHVDAQIHTILLVASEHQRLPCSYDSRTTHESEKKRKEKKKKISFMFEKRSNVALSHIHAQKRWVLVVMI